jgi:hypothetical protein
MARNEATEGAPQTAEEAFAAWAARIEHALLELRIITDAAGCAAVGSNVLLAHWMSRTGGSGATEGDLAEALAVAAQSAWTAQLRVKGVVTDGETEEPQ